MLGAGIAIILSMTASIPAEIEVYAGQVVSLEICLSSNKGSGSIVWDRADNNGTTVLPGIYLAKLRADNLEISSTNTTKLILL